MASDEDVWRLVYRRPGGPLWQWFLSPYPFPGLQSGEDGPLCVGAGRQPVKGCVFDWPELA